MGLGYGHGGTGLLVINLKIHNMKLSLLLPFLLPSLMLLCVVILYGCEESPSAHFQHKADRATEKALRLIHHNKIDEAEELIHSGNEYYHIADSLRALGK